MKDNVGGKEKGEVVPEYNIGFSEQLINAAR